MASACRSPVLQSSFLASRQSYSAPLSTRRFASARSNAYAMLVLMLTFIVSLLDLSA